jgi:hypothetical protein
MQTPLTEVNAGALQGKLMTVVHVDAAAPAFSGPSSNGGATTVRSSVRAAHIPW